MSTGPGHSLLGLSFEVSFRFLQREERGRRGRVENYANHLFVLLSFFFNSGSAVELPFVYRTDDEGNVNLLDNLRMGANLIREVSFSGYILLLGLFRSLSISARL